MVLSFKEFHTDLVKCGKEVHFTPVLAVKGKLHKALT